MAKRKRPMTLDEHRMLADALLGAEERLRTARDIASRSYPKSAVERIQVTINRVGMHRSEFEDRMLAEIPGLGDDALLVYYPR